VQIARQLLAGFLFSGNQALLLLLKIAIEDGVLQAIVACVPMAVSRSI
jgi:hypothetical protein